MPSLPYLTDTSTQLTGTYTASTSTLDNFITSNYVSNVSNLLIANINTKQATLTAATNLVGIGSAITALDYNKITINKPSVFPADMTNIYSKTETNSLLDAKQATLTAATNLLGVGSAITALDYNKITLNKPTDFQANWNTTVINKPTNFQSDYNTTVINKPTYVSPLSSNLATNQISINLSSYSTTGTDANYLLKTGGSMTGAIVNTSTTTSEFKGIQFAHTARITHIPYIPDGNIYFRAPVIIDNIADYLSFGSRLGDNIIRLYGTNFGFGINDSTLRYNVPAGSVHRFYNGTTNTVWIDDTGRLKATTFEGSGASLTNVPYASITSVPDFLLKSGGTMTGTLNGTTINATTALQESGTNLTSKYLQLAGGTLTGTLNGTTIFTTGNVGVGTNNQIASLVVGNIDADGSDGSIAFSKRQNVGTKRNFKMGMNGDYTFCIGDYGAGNTTANPWSTNYFNIRYADGNVGIGIQGSGSYKLYVDGTTYFNNNSTVNGTLTATTFSGSGASLTNLPLSAYSTTGNDASYLLKTGGVMTGQITGVTTLNGTTGIFSTISTTNTTNLNTPQLGAFGGIGDRFILYVGTASVHPYSLGMNSGVLWYSVPATSSHIFYVAGSPITTISSTGLSTTGNIGIGTATIDEKMHIYTTGLINAFIKVDAGGGTGQSGLRLFAGSGTINRATRIDFFNNVASPTIPKWTLISGGDQNGTNDFRIYNGSSIRMTFLESGNIGIGTLTPNNIFQVGDGARLRISNGVNDYSLIGTKDVDDNTNTRIVISGNTRGGYEGQIQYLATAGSHIFYTSAINERMRISNNGNVGIGTNNPRSLLNITGTNPILTIMGQGGVGAKSQLDLATYDNTTFLSPCSLIATDNGTFGSTFQINQKTSGANANAQFTSLSISSAGDVGIGTATSASYKLSIGGAINATGSITTGTNLNNYLSGLRLNGGDTGNTIWQDTGDLGINANTGYSVKLGVGNSGEKMRIHTNGYVGINNTNPKSHLYVNGIAGINNGSEYAITNNYMASGSLTIGGQNANYGCGYNWSTSTAGLMMECLDNTEIMIHDSGNRLVSPMAYYGGPNNNRIIIGRDAGWGNTPVTIPNSLTIDTNLYFTNRIQDHILNLYGTANYSFGINSGTLRYNSDGVHKFYCGGAESTTIDNKGIIIGTFTNHYYPLVVNKTINGTLSYVYVRTGWNGGSDYNTNSITTDISSSFAGAIHVSANILNSSDIRIKKEINDINDDGALQQILAIEPKTYKYIDYLSRGNSTVYGFIAQQVKAVIPHAVETVKDIIPNIYKRASCSSNIITLENDVSQDLNINDNIKIYDEFGNDNMYNITEINSNVIKIDKDINTSNIFVFGKEIEDFHTLKKDYIFTLNVCATQELYRIIQQQQQQIDALIRRIEILESR